MQMVAGRDEQFFVGFANHQRVGEPVHQDSSQLTVNAGVQLRRLCRSMSCRTDGVQKALTEPWPLLIVPQSCFSDFQVSRRRENNAASRLCNYRI